jgi:predicted phosphodiesterase
MAAFGIVADIHGNREALGVAIDALEARGVARLICLGDIVGYNADPDECVELLRERGALAIAGNHDLIGTRQLDFGRCSNKAAFALKRTRRRLAPRSTAFLTALPPYRSLPNGVLLVHGGVRDVEQYMTSSAHIRQNAAYLRADFPGTRVCFFGHSHEQRVYELKGDAVREIELDAGSIALDPELLYFINPGSVDASRKRAHKQAECARFDPDSWSIEFLSVAYDASTSEAKAAAGGYRIDPLTDRLYELHRRIFGSSLRRALR